VQVQVPWNCTTVLLEYKYKNLDHKYKCKYKYFETVLKYYSTLCPEKSKPLDNIE